MKRPEQHITETKSQRIFENIIPVDWVCRDIKPDYGIDFLVEIFEKKGLDAYRKYQLEHKTDILETGVAYPFIKRFLRINDIYTEEQPIEVVLLSRNSPETGVRVFNSIRQYNLNITRAAFMSGGSAINYIPAFNISLFLATKEMDVKEAIEANLPAGRILQTNVHDDETFELRVAFDFDGVVANDEAERIYKERGIW